MYAITASAPMAIQKGDGDFGVVITVVGGLVIVGGMVVTGTGTVVTAVVGGSIFTILKKVEAVTSCVIPETLTMYSSGLKAVASTSNDQWLYPPLPGTTVTVPEAPENSPLCVFSVGWKEDEVTSTERMSPAARFVEPEMVNLSPTK
jgi:hypothetical protein